MSTTIDTTPLEDDPSGDEMLWGHPKGLYVCFTTELWERFSFYGMKYLLLLYLTKYHLFTDEMGLDVLGAYAGLVYALPVIGGLLADRYLGMRKAVVFGGILLSMGHLLMAVEGVEAMFYAAGTVLTNDLSLADGTVITAGTTLLENVTVRDTAALDVFYLAIAMIVMGVGFLKPNISTIVGKLYTQDDPRRDSGFTIFYMGINIGSFAATLLCGWLGETYGWRYGFGAAGIGMMIGLSTFLYGQRYLQGHAEPSNPELLKEKVFGIINREYFIYLCAVLSIGGIWYLVQDEPVVYATQNAMLVIAIVGIILYSMFHSREGVGKGMGQSIAGITVILGLIAVVASTTSLLGDAEVMGEYLVYATIISLIAFISYGFKYHNSAEYGRTVTLMFLILSTVVFWALFEQSAGSMTLYADRVMNREIMGNEIKASMFGSLNAGFIMLLAIPFSALWIWLAKRNLEPSTPVKFALGIFQAGLGFGALVIGAEFPDASGKVAMIWLVLAYLLHTTGELCLSPVGLSAVTKLSVSRVVGVSMGTWFLATALSETVATRLGKMAAIDTSGVETATIAETLSKYTELYQFLMLVGVGMGIFMFIISPLLRKGMHGIH